MDGLRSDVAASGHEDQSLPSPTAVMNVAVASFEIAAAVVAARVIGIRDVGAVAEAVVRIVVSVEPVVAVAAVVEAAIAYDQDWRFQAAIGVGLQVAVG